jgi:FAD/FMN-containing dehydrogenase
VLTRRQLLLGTTALAACGRRPPGGPAPAGIVLNDVHAQLSPTAVARVSAVDSLDAVGRAVAEAREAGQALSIAGGRHAMGGQQFGAGTVCLDTRGLRRVLGFDAERGLVEAEAGIQWPELIASLQAAQRRSWPQWTIRQKQTGADRLSLGGALSANVHGRGLRFRPFVEDVESFVLVTADGAPLTVSRREHPELFRLVIGGYGLFGVIAAVTLRLVPRRKLRRVVEVMNVEQLVPAVEQRIGDGFLYGDFQYATDGPSDDFLRRGVFSCYRPVGDATVVPERQRELSAEDWGRLLYLSHADKPRAFAEYAAYYLSTDGQLYWSDTHQLGFYLDDYHAALDRRLGATTRATEMISEVYVPRRALVSFLGAVAEDFRKARVDVVYGTIRFIERDDETVLAWAREPWACVIFNLHVVHTEAGLEAAREAFRRLIDHGLRHGGSYFLTYHRWATRSQVEAAHPRFVEFLRAKRRHDPEERFQSEWYRHYRALFADAL